jgi:hypothetical protein
MELMSERITKPSGAGSSVYCDFPGKKYVDIVKKKTDRTFMARLYEFFCEPLIKRS